MKQRLMLSYAERYRAADKQARVGTKKGIIMTIRTSTDPLLVSDEYARGGEPITAADALVEIAKALRGISLSAKEHYLQIWVGERTDQSLESIGGALDKIATAIRKSDE